MFERVTWQEDRILIGDLVFHLDQQEEKSTGASPDGFFLHKPLRLLEQYRTLWRHRPQTPKANMLELGIFDGGSIAFWCELLQPDKYVALDIKNGDRTKFLIDDASHHYAPTRASFETLFPLLRPGGLFIIEDWSWGCWPNLPKGFARAGTELPKLIHQIVNVAGSMNRFLTADPGNPSREELKPLIASVTTYPDLVVVERGDAAAADVSDFDLERYATFRPPGRSGGWLRRIRRAWK